MGTEFRRGRPYYYRKERHGSRVRSVYIGGGLLAEYAAMRAEDSRAERDLERDYDRHRRRRWLRRSDAPERPLAAYSGGIEDVFRGVMAAAGFRLHKRSEWRRHMGTEAATRDAKALAILAAPDVLTGLLDRASRGDFDALPELQAVWDWIDRSGKAGDLARILGGDAARESEDALVRGYAGRDLAKSEAARRKLATLRGELAGPQPSPIERMLAERAAQCWLALYHYEAKYAAAPKLSTWQADHYQRRIDGAHRRFLSALKALATVRKLALPALQVNIAEKQVNVSR